MLRVLKRRIRRAIAAHCTVGECRESLVELLERPGYGLHVSGPCRAGVLTLESYSAVAGPPATAVFDAAAAVEMCMTAGYVFDAVADGGGGSLPDTACAEELALAVLLLTAAAGQATLVCSDRRVPGGFRILERFHGLCAKAAMGQFLDARLERDDDVTPSRALLATCLKAGSFGRLAAGFGAALATSDRNCIRRFERFGFNLFAHAQLIDDLRDAVGDHEKSDLVRGKKTVPLVFFRRHAGLSSGGNADGTIAAASRRVFVECGAALYGRAVAEVFMRRARSCLAELAERRISIGSLDRALGRMDCGSAIS